MLLSATEMVQILKEIHIKLEYQIQTSTVQDMGSPLKEETLEKLKKTG